MLNSGSGTGGALSRWCIAVGLLLSIGMSGPAGARPDAREYERVIAAARAGNFDFAIPKLREWVRLYPDDRRIRSDYGVALAWAGRDEEVVELGRELDRDDTPAYALIAYANAARNLQRYDVAIAAYRRVLRREPGNREAIAGYTVTLTRSGRVEEALTVIQGTFESIARPYTRNVVPLLHALGYTLQAKGLFIEAADAYTEALRLAPDDRNALRERVFLTARMGAPHLALLLAEKRSEFFTEKEMFELQSDRAAVSVRWGEAQLAADAGRRRFYGIDVSLGLSEQLVRTRQQRGGPAGREPGRNEFDHIVALRDRVAMRDVVTWYETVAGRKPDGLPNYVVVAVADAYLYLRSPQRARDLYLVAIERVRAEGGKVPTEWRYSLFYAYVESGRFDEAKKLIDALVAEVPAFRNPGVEGWQRDNPGFARARTTQGLLRLYTGELKEAQIIFDRILDEAPFNVGARTAYGSLLVARDRLRAANDVFRGVLVDDPAALHARIGFAETEMSLRRYDVAARTLAETYREYPENLAARNALARLELARRGRARLDLNIGRSNGGTNATGTRDREIEAYVASPAIDYRWRVHTRAYSGEARFDGNVARRERLGVGGEYAYGDWEGVAEINADRSGANVGLTLRGVWTPSDDWRFRAGLDTNSNDIPLKARLYGIDAKGIKLGATRSFNEARRIDVNYGYWDFDDGNQRHSLQVSWLERWFTRPTYRFESVVGVYTSRNDRDDAPYFNPGRDVDADVTLLGEHLTWRNPSTTFRQRVALSAGAYSQQGYGTRPVYGLRLEHEWEGSETMSLRYGIGRSRHPYDGAQVERDYFYLGLNWRF